MSVVKRVGFLNPRWREATTGLPTQDLGGNVTRVTWEVKGSTAYPMNIIYLFIDKKAGADPNERPANLKNMMERKLPVVQNDVKL